MTRPLRSLALAIPFILLLSPLLACGGSKTTPPPALSSDAALSSLAVSTGTLSPAFASGTLSYTLVVPHGATTVNVTPTTDDPDALSVAVGQDNGALFTIDSGQPSSALTVPAFPATTTVRVRVIAQDGTGQDYSLVTWQAPAPPSTNAALASLAVSAGTMSPAFSSSTTAYSLTIPNGTASFTVTPTSQDATATIAVSQDAGAFAAVSSGHASAALATPAVSATSTVTVRVTAQDGVTTMSYVLTVTQASQVVISPDATLSALAPSAGSLSPAFASGTFAYALAAPNGTSSVTVTPTANDSHATIAIEQDAGAFAAVASGSASAPLTVPATGASSTVTVLVTAQDGTTTQSYVLTLTQAAPSSDAVAFYSLTVDQTCTATGSAACDDETFAGVYAKNYQIPSTTSTTWSPSQPDSTITQRVSIIGDTWPGSESAPDPDRYAQFTAEPAAGATWNIDTISLWIGAAGGSKLGFDVQYSTDPNFNDEVTLLDSGSNAEYAMIFETYPVSITLQPGDTLYIRVLPWLSGAAASGKYVCLQSLTVHGTTQ